MDERTPESGFVPFVPRRVSGGYGSPTGGPSDPQQAQPAEAPAGAPLGPRATEQTSPPLDVAERQPTTEPVADTGLSEHPGAGIETDASTPEPVAQDRLLVPREQPIVCRHEHLIRNEAIRLAAIACGRALRHAALVHPQVIAGFVNDALEAAGNPERFSVSSSGPDGALDCGEVLIHCDGSLIGADPQTRAELLVRAAACA